ncbi:hypothetical protein PR048_031769 [Dryococelus australis]|uniref:MADF domain-containing protein n=1 Tax=Dryococelus australis TaxID=614101 RepID=A0ABQ9G684_9NEOP|nr:hypothetical protein PR048_031769 [Dryococelus australis]
MSDIEVNLEILITLVEQRPVFWDKILYSFKDCNLTKEAWRRIYVCLNEDFERLSDAEISDYGKFNKHSTIAEVEAHPVEQDGDKYTQKKNKKLGAINTGSAKPATRVANKGLSGTKGRKLDEFDLKTIAVLQQEPHTDSDRNFNFFKGIIPSIKQFNE